MPSPQLRRPSGSLFRVRIELLRSMALGAKLSDRRNSRDGTLCVCPSAIARLCKAALGSQWTEYTRLHAASRAALHLHQSAALQAPVQADTSGYVPVAGLKISAGLNAAAH